MPHAGFVVIIYSSCPSSCLEFYPDMLCHQFSGYFPGFVMGIRIFTAVLHCRCSVFITAENKSSLWQTWRSDSVVHGCFTKSFIMQPHGWAEKGATCSQNRKRTDWWNWQEEVTYYTCTANSHLFYIACGLGWFSWGSLILNIQISCLIYVCRASAKHYWFIS